MELGRCFNMIKRWWWLLVVGTIIPMGISYYFVSKQPVLYQAKVTLMVRTTALQPSLDPNTAKRLAQAYTELVKRRPITQAVIQRLNLERSPEELAEQITAWIIPETSLLEIMVTDTNPQAAALIANALADELIKQSPGSVDLTVIEPAVEPTQPVSGRSNLILPVAGAAGLALAVVFVIFYECLASRVQD
jgi:succinoglycan biosynthesis transport protein ExoP